MVFCSLHDCFRLGCEDCRRRARLANRVVCENSDEVVEATRKFNEQKAFVQMLVDKGGIPHE
jgi:hypothetical protein